MAKNISQQTGNPDVFAIEIDLGSFDSVRAFASQLLAKRTVVDVLINDAGITGEQVQRITADGFEETIQVCTIDTGSASLIPATRSRVLRRCVPGELSWARTADRTAPASAPLIEGVEGYQHGVF